MACFGQRSGKPRFKGKGRYRTFTFPQASHAWLAGNRVKLPKLGAVKFICHRPLPQGFDLKTVAVMLKADGWYVTFSLEDQSVPEQPVVDSEPTEANSIGVDAGLEYFIACSDGSTPPPPKFYRQVEGKLAKLQTKQATRAKGSKARRQLNERIARLHQRIARQRRPGQAAKSGLNKLSKSFADAGIAGFLNDILPDKAVKAGKRAVKVNPAGMFQQGARCLNRVPKEVPKELSDRWHTCPHCGASMPRDLQSGILIKTVGLGQCLRHGEAERLTIKCESGATWRRELAPYPLAIDIGSMSRYTVT